jgi:hypothetical protein
MVKHFGYFVFKTKEQKATTYAHVPGNIQAHVYFSSAILLMKTLFRLNIANR